MNASLRKRILAYLLDALVLSFFVSIITFVFININANVITLEDELTNISQLYMEGKITFSNFVNNYASTMYLVEREYIIVNVLNAFSTLLLFVIIPFYNNGQTIGKKILKIKIVDEDGSKVSINSLLIRSLFINSLGYLFITLALIFILNNLSYFILTSILTIIEFLLVIISVFMISYRRDKCALHDKIAHTKVINV